MITGVINEEEITRGKINARASKFENLTIPFNQLQNYESKGWEVRRTNKKTYGIKREKPHDIGLEGQGLGNVRKNGFHYLKCR